MPRLSLLAVLACQGFALAINGVAAPWMMDSFALDQPAIARAFAWISLSALGAFALARQADLHGRKRILTLSMVLGSICALTAAAVKSLPAFIVLDTVVVSAAGASIACTVVWIAEISTDRHRASGQAFGGLAVALGSGPCVLLMPLLARAGWSWRTLLVLFAASVLVVPFLPAGEGTSVVIRQSNSAALADEDRRRAAALVMTTILSTIATATVDAWRYVHMVNDAHLAPALASVVIVIAGMVAMVGFPLGTLASNRFGRIRSTAVSLLLMTTAIGLVFWGPPRSVQNSWLWFGVGLSAVALFGNAITVSANTAINELFPAHFRTTMFGWLNVAGSVGRVGAQTLVAVLTPMLSTAAAAVGMLALAGIPAAALLLWLVPDTLKVIRVAKAAGAES